MQRYDSRWRNGRVCCLLSELHIYKFDWSLCNQAVQNSEINILPRASPLTVSMKERDLQISPLDAAMCSDAVFSMGI